MIFYWTAILAISTLLYVLFDGLDLGVGIISGGAGSHARRDAMMNAIAPIWDGNVHGAAIGGPAPSAKPCNRAGIGTLTECRTDDCAGANVGSR